MPTSPNCRLFLPFQAACSAKLCARRRPNGVTMVSIYTSVSNGKQFPATSIVCTTSFGVNLSMPPASRVWNNGATSRCGKQVLFRCGKENKKVVCFCGISVMFTQKIWCGKYVMNRQSGAAELVYEFEACGARTTGKMLRVAMNGNSSQCQIFASKFFNALVLKNQTLNSN